MADLLRELHEGEYPDATFYLEDGTPALYDWPSDVEHRPEEAMAIGSYWHRSGSGGK